MPKTNITSLVTVVSTLSLIAAAGLATGLADQAKAQNKQAEQQKTALPQTTKLEQNDNLDPTVNRTQAMRTEAETGSIAPITGTEKVTNAKPKAKVMPKSIKGKKVFHEY
jgi:hypothetical protein